MEGSPYHPYRARPRGAPLWRRGRLNSSVSKWETERPNVDTKHVIRLSDSKYRCGTKLKCCFESSNVAYIGEEQLNPRNQW